MNQGQIQGALRRLDASVNRRLAVFHMDVADRTGRLLDRYHLMHVAALYYRLDWLELPLWKRVWLRLTGQKPDVKAIALRQLEEWDAEHMKKACPSKDPETETECELPNGHEGPHQGLRQSRLIGGEMRTVEWETEVPGP